MNEIIIKALQILPLISTVLCEFIHGMFSPYLLPVSHFIPVYRQV